MGKGGYGKGGRGGYYGYQGQKGLLFWVEDDDELWERQNRGWSQQRRQDWRPEWVAMKNTELRALREAEECSARVLETETELRTTEERRLESETELAKSNSELASSEQRRKHWKKQHYYAEKECKAYREEVAAQECAKASESAEAEEWRAKASDESAEASEWRAKASESAAELSKPRSLPSRLRNFLLGFLVTLSCRHVRLLWAWALGSSAECHRQVPAYYEVDIIVISQTLPGASPATNNATGHGAASDHFGRWAPSTLYSPLSLA
ncbi:unnamed protein product [Symbiodinium microadriaticum]|nr:unnamed protein product [Symbiodinium microadriaticum]CAE7316133.1 unnamed protein product [Symbiodinium sp. KB8]